MGTHYSRVTTMPRSTKQTGQEEDVRGGEEVDGADDAIVRRRKARESRQRKNVILLLACVAVVLGVVGTVGVVQVLKVGGKVVSSIPREQSEEDVMELVEKLRARGMKFEIERSGPNDLLGMGPFAKCRMEDGGSFLIQQKKTVKEAEVIRSMHQPKNNLAAFAYGRFAIMGDVKTIDQVRAALNLTTGP